MIVVDAKVVGGDQPVMAIVKVEEPFPGHFHWPEIDVDLTVDMIEHPERFALAARGG